MKIGNKRIRYLKLKSRHNHQLRSCVNVFKIISFHIIKKGINRINSRIFSLDGCLPTIPEDARFDPSIKTISKDFCAIFNEAQKAERLQLIHVCGPGYRKALEFLIKDYVSKLHPTPEDKAKIEKMPLMTCITEYVKDPKVKSMAARAVWLGNDEVHYLRKWEGKDLRDLKILIQLTSYWIVSEQLTNDAVQDMPEGKK